MGRDEPGLFLSLGRPPEQPAARLSRAEALLVSVAAHLLLILLIWFLPARLPAALVAFLNPRLPADGAAEAAADASPEDAAAEVPPIPLKFVYVKVPNDTPVDENPTARLLSDRNRRARQEEPTPPDATQFSIDPHSEGDTITRVIPDPSRPEGPESEEPTEAAGPEERPQEAAIATLRDGSEEGEAGGGGPAEPVDDGPGLLAQKTGHGGDGGGADAGSGREDDGSGRPMTDSLQGALTDLETGEYKYTFDNPAYLKGGSDYGTMSFDTKDFPWGDYARQIYVRIRNNWYERIPLAAREGMAGYSCYRFVIARSGEIAETQSVRASSIPPFNIAAANAIRASDPLPPLPAHFPGESEGVTFCFYYNMYPD